MEGELEKISKKKIEINKWQIIKGKINEWFERQMEWVFH